MNMQLVSVLMMNLSWFPTKESDLKEGDLVKVDDSSRLSWSFLVILAGAM